MLVIGDQVGETAALNAGGLEGDGLSTGRPVDGAL
jgi:hypothetical protein